MATIDEDFSAAFAHHQAGRWLQAEQLYRQILNVAPQHADAWHLLGVVGYQVGRRDLAVEYIRQAIALSPHAATYHLNLGGVFLESGRFEEAIACFTQVVRLMPDHVEAHGHLGNAYMALGKCHEAQACYRQALELQPDLAETHCRLAKALQMTGDLEAATVHCQRAVQLQPNFAEAYNRLGVLLHARGLLDEAQIQFEQVVRLRPDWSSAYSNLGAVLLVKNRFDAAIVYLRKAIELEPANAEALGNLALVLKNQRRFDEAIVVCRQAVESAPHSASAHLNLANTLRAQNRYEEAIACCRQALRLDPHSSSAHSSLGHALLADQQLDAAVASFREAVRLDSASADALINLSSTVAHQGHMEEAVSYCTRALRLQPDNAQAHWNRALFWLASGNFEQGWPELEWRLHHQARGLKRDFPEDFWTGADLSGQTILLHAEGGFGDALQFVRYAPLVQQRGGRVILECQPELKSLLCGVAGVQQVVGRGIEPLPAFKVQCPLQSLPRAFGTSLSTIPASVPYLTVDPRRIAAFRDRVSTDQAAFRVGLVWSGSAKEARVNHPNCTLNHFAPLAEIKNVVFYSLQKGQPAEQAKFPPRGMKLVDFTADLTDFAETGALIANLDLVISVDTSVVHLAGALGYPAWVMLAYVPDFRWLLNREDSPWYPTLRLFRQSILGDWGEVFQRVADQLRKHVEGLPNPSLVLDARLR